MLICDHPTAKGGTCDKGYHMYCLTPPVRRIPPDEWYGPCCKKAELIELDEDDDDDDEEEEEEEEADDHSGSSSSGSDDEDRKRKAKKKEPEDPAVIELRRQEREARKIAEKALRDRTEEMKTKRYR
jgi:hypothetical protein